MKQINNYIQEKLKLNKSVIDKHQCTLFPKDKKQLIKMIKTEIKQNGNECSLNHINTSEITDMSLIFSGYYNLNNFNGDISNWNISNVENMLYMFSGSHFNGDISNWDVSNVENMKGIFANSKFNKDISKWDVSNVKTMDGMFFSSDFNGDISKWDVSSVESMTWTFENSKFNGNISKWDVSKVKDMCGMFTDSQFNGNISDWEINPDCNTENIFYNCKIKNEYKPKSLQG